MQEHDPKPSPTDRTQLSGTSRSALGRAWLPITLLLALVLVAPRAEASDEKHAAAEDTQENLLIGYALLDQSISGEGMLKWLLLLRKATFEAPAKATQDLLTRISKTSAKRAEELKTLRRLVPEVTAKPPPSPIGDAIQAAASDAGEHEMLFPDGEFDIRFLFLQAQATRMISVIAEQIAKIDPNEQRRKWLVQVGHEYEAFRDELVASLADCVPSE